MDWRENEKVRRQDKIIIALVEYPKKKPKARVQVPKITIQEKTVKQQFNRNNKKLHTERAHVLKKIDLEWPTLRRILVIWFLLKNKKNFVLPGKMTKSYVKERKSGY